MTRAGDALRVLYVWDADYPWDVRTEKVCSALTAAGMQVHIAARNRRREAPVAHLHEGTVHRLAPWSALNDASSFPAFFNPRWCLHLSRLTRAIRPQVIIVRDLPLCPTARWVARREGIPVMLDMAENYPAMIADLWITGTRRPLDVIVRNPSLVRLVERRMLPLMDHVLVVVEESAQRLVDECRVDPDRITIVSNTPPAARVATSDTSSRSGSAPTVVYLGLMELARGVGDLIDACALLRDEGTPMRLRLIGDGRDFDTLRRRAADLHLDGQHVEFLGRVRHAAALELVAKSDIGVVPHHANESWNTTIPNKLFDYMAAGLSVVSSDALPCVRVLAHTGAGVTFRSGDARSLADALRSLRAPEARARYAASGKRAIRSEYNWEHDADRLVGAVISTVDGMRARATVDATRDMNRKSGPTERALRVPTPMIAQQEENG